jgi:hypothetical protein
MLMQRKSVGPPSDALADPLEWNWACAAVEGFRVAKGCAEERLHHLDCEE